MAILMVKRTLFSRKLLIPQRRRTALVGVGHGPIKLCGQTKDSLMSIRTVPSATHTCQVKASCYSVARIECSWFRPLWSPKTLLQSKCDK